MIHKIRNGIKDKTHFRGKITHYLAKFVAGKYFSQDDTIWLVQGKGVDLPTLVHEFLHSIQVCRPHRENIVEYLVYKLLKDCTLIDERKLNEWREIEKQVGWKGIKQRLVLEGDCEDM